MDDLDIKILDALQIEGRLTNFELSEIVGLSASQCSRRRALLEETAVIGNYHAELAPEALGLGVTAFIQVRLATHSPDNSTKFVDLLDQIPNVQEAYALTGEADYLVKLIVTDLKALARVLNEVFLPHDTVAHVRSSIVLDRLKQTRRLPLDHLRKPARDDKPARRTTTRSPRRKRSAR